MPDFTEKSHIQFMESLIERELTSDWILITKREGFHFSSEDSTKSALELLAVFFDNMLRVAPFVRTQYDLLKNYLLKMLIPFAWKIKFLKQ